MANLRLKMKIGDHEFEADGAAEDVSAQMSTFVRLLGREDQVQAKPSTEPVEQDAFIHKLVRVAGNVLSVRSSTASVENVVLVLMLAQHRVRKTADVSGRHIMDGLRSSGHTVERVDRILKKHAASGLVVAIGKRRRRRYRLTTDGAIIAQKIARTLAADLPEPSAEPKTLAARAGR
jgi:hypothetical protein